MSADLGVRGNYRHRETSLREVAIKEILVVIARQPYFFSIRRVDLGIAPDDLPGWFLTAGRLRTSQGVLGSAGDNHSGEYTPSEPGRSGAPPLGALVTEFATTTAKYGKITAPKAGRRSHQPDTKKQAPIQTSRKPIAMEYLTIRVLRSRSGESASDVTA